MLGVAYIRYASGQHGVRNSGAVEKSSASDDLGSVMVKETGGDVIFSATVMGSGQDIESYCVAVGSENACSRLISTRYGSLSTAWRVRVVFVALLVLLVRYMKGGGLRSREG